ncbi:hypothetical protein [Paenibacillus popilliae]|nr:hypothetical protein [Paenibacillus sp. SDF0028]
MIHLYLMLAIPFTSGNIDKTTDCFLFVIAKSRSEAWVLDGEYES